MKVGYLISNINSKSKGQGGHYHSLALTEKMMRARCETFSVYIGTFPPEAMGLSDGKNYFVLFSGYNLFSAFRALREIIDRERPEVVHAFDIMSYFWARLLCRTRKLRCCLTKCGGQNPKVYWPYSRQLILYSGENLAYFKSRKKFSRTSLHLVPNRVERFVAHSERISAMRDSIHESHPEYRLVLMRIARIGPYYKHSTMQLVELLNRLRADGVDCCAVLIGTIEDEDTYRAIRQAGGEHLYVFCDGTYTRNAKELIDLADVVVGTGRSFMEGAAFGKIMLAPLKGASIPVLVDQQLFPSALHYNFSERLQVPGYDERSNYESIKMVVTDAAKGLRQREFSQWMFTNYFDGIGLIDRHMEIYAAHQEREPPRLFDMVLHLMFVLRKFLV